MSFDLRTHFIGLALYVPQGEEAMHVLLPSTAGHVHPEPGPEQPGGRVHPNGEEPGDTHAVDAHFARVMFDKAYLKPGNPRLLREYVMLDLQGRVLDLRGLDAGPLNPTISDELAPMDRVAHPVERALVTELPDHRVAGRISFDAGALTDCSLGARWRLNGGNPLRLTLDTEWTIRGIKSTDPNLGNAPFLPGRVLPGAQDPVDLPEEEKIKLPNLYPVADTIHLMVFYTVANQIPPAGKFDIGEPDPDDDRPDHFLAYYGICNKREDVTPALQVPIPAEARKVVVDGPPLPATTIKEFPSLGCVQGWATLAS